MLEPSELDYWAIEFDKTYPLPPQELLGSVVKRGWLGKKETVYFCKRCGKTFQINHICDTVYYHIWNSYISFRKTEFRELSHKMKGKFGF